MYLLYFVFTGGLELTYKLYYVLGPNKAKSIHLIEF